MKEHLSPLTSLALTALCCGLCACSSARGHGEQDRWIELTAGDRLDAWRGFGREDVPAGWSLTDGVLAFTPGVEGGDLVTRAEFEDFELRLEWKVAEGGNSGVFFRVVEEGHDYPWRTGPEMQVLDDERHPDGRDRRTAAGANYGLHPAPSGVVRPAGQWNAARIVVRGRHVEHWLNGRRLLAYELLSPAWEELVAASKFASMPGYGRAPLGRIALQDHGDPVWFRDVRVRRLP